MTTSHVHHFTQVEGVGVDTIELHAWGREDPVDTCEIPVITWACACGEAVDEPVVEAPRP